MDDNEKKYWIRNWWNWFYSIEEYNHPAYAYGGIRKNDILQGRRPYGILPTGTPLPEKNLWFLSGSYGAPAEVKSIMKVGFTRLLAPAYNIGASQEEFPSLKREEIQEFVTRDVDKVTFKLAELDGCDITDRLERKQWDFTDWFPVSNIPEENIGDLEEENISICCDGWWLFLDENDLQVGDHILTMKGEAHNYRTETRYNITVRGGK